MSDVEEIEQAVKKLGPAELAKFRAWFEAYDADEFDRKIEEDATSGRLDALGDEALEDYRAGRTREI